MKYKIVVDDDSDGLALKVNQEIQDDWRPQGGVAVVISEKTRKALFLQAMVKVAQNR